jgi:hypothetical protein
VSARQCTDARGHVNVDPRDHRIHRCIGGRFNGQIVR